MLSKIKSVLTHVLKKSEILYLYKSQWFNQFEKKNQKTVKKKYLPLYPDLIPIIMKNPIVLLFTIISFLTIFVLMIKGKLLNILYGMHSSLLNTLTYLIVYYSANTNYIYAYYRLCFGRSRLPHYLVWWKLEWVGWEWEWLLYLYTF